MKAFRRIFKYVWPQWPRITVVVSAALIVGVLFTLSFATILPLLKVMMGEEGMHGWADRKICHWRYGVDFYVPEIADVANEGSEIAYYLLITNVDDESEAYKAGLREQDRIVGAVDMLVGAENEKVLSTDLLKTLAVANSNKQMVIQVMRTDSEGMLRTEMLELNSGIKKGYIEKLEWLISFVPRDQSKTSKEKTVVIIILIMSVVTIVRCMATFVQAYMASKVVKTATTALRTDVFAHSMSLPLAFFTGEGTSDTTSRLINDIGATSKGVSILLGKALREPLKAVGTLTLAFCTNWQLTLIFIGCAPVTIGLGAFLGKKIKKATRQSLVSNAKVLGKLHEAMGALSVVKVYNRQGYERQVFDEVNKKFLKRSLKVAKVDALTGPIMEILGMVAGSAALLVGVHWVTNSSMQSSSFFMLLIYLGVTAESVRKSSNIWNKAQQSNAAAERVFAVVDQPAEYQKQNAVEMAPLQNKIEFKNISFKYPKSDRNILENLNLTIKSGQTVAVVGPNGSGKTTLINLLPRFYDPQQGQVLFDGVDIKDMTLQSLRTQISMVSQKVVTFNDTVAANIGYGKEDATQEEIIAAAQRAYAHEFIDPLPDGYNTVIGEHSSGFSGGQLQRIVIARAILKDPSILIFDEAMSQVDADSEAKINKALAEIIRNRTCFVIAHRFSTVISADSIVVMNNGQIAAQGKHEELVETCSLYKSLYETQLIVS